MGHGSYGTRVDHLRSDEMFVRQGQMNIIIGVELEGGKVALKVLKKEARVLSRENNGVRC